MMQSYLEIQRRARSGVQTMYDNRQTIEMVNENAVIV